MPDPRQAASNGQPRDFPFRPPTLIPTPKPTQNPAAEATQPAKCVNRLTFISDVTVPDGTEVEPNASIDKRWEVENNGTCNWTSKYRLKLIAGPDLGVKPEQALVPNRAGTRGTIRLMFKAPSEAGTYRSAWQAYGPDDVPFGDPVYIEIVVK